MASMSVSEFRSQLRRAMARAEAGEEIEITRDGEVAAVLVHPSRLRKRVRTPSTVAAKRLHERLEQYRKDNREWVGPGLSTEFGEWLVGEIRKDRDRDR